jgi:acetyl-CoA hydrolase
MNGIGGSGDFTRSAYLSIFACPSTVRGGRISTIVPHCSHVDHSGHSVQAVVTEQGHALLRCEDPKTRARLVIDHCAHPDYQDDLTGYFESATCGYTPQTFGLAFAMHQKYLQTGDMRDVDWGALSRLSTLLRSRESQRLPFDHEPGLEE